MKYTLMIFLIVILSGCEYMKVDKCLDNGGKWDYENKACISSDSI